VSRSAAERSNGDRRRARGEREREVEGRACACLTPYYFISGFWERAVVGLHLEKVEQKMAGNQEGVGLTLWFYEKRDIAVATRVSNLELERGKVPSARRASLALSAHY